MERKYLARIFEIGSWTIAILAFSFYCFQTYKEYSEFKTGWNQFQTLTEELPLPAITICSKEIYKNLGNKTSFENFENHVFEWQDFFTSESLARISGWKLREIFSPYIGLCFTIFPNQTVNQYNIHKTWLDLRRNFNVTFQIFLHEFGCEYWRQTWNSPCKFSHIEIDPKAMKNVALILVKLKVFVHENVQNENCEPKGTMETFTKCCLSQLKNNCTMIIDKFDQKFNQTKFCKEKYQQKLFEQLTNLRELATKGKKCLKPCKSFHFEAKIQEIHQNLWIFDGANKELQSLTLAWIFDEYKIETFKEFYIMNLDSVVAIIGGYLGLFLGISLLTISNLILSSIRQIKLT